ncbi:MAG: peptidase S41, partial [Terriglobales bacterium]
MKAYLGCILAAAAAVAGAQSASLAVPARHAMTQPALSADGGTIAFASEGAIWTVAAQGGVAHLLISDAASNAHPMYSPDGTWLAFESQRSGNGDIYLFDLASAQLRRLSWDDGSDALDGWSPDSQWVYFSSTSHNIGGMNDIYRVRIAGGTPLPVSSERYVNEFFAAPAPDGTLAFAARGLASAQWWRNGHAHIDETEIWRVAPATAASKAVYTRLLSSGGAKNLWPMWGADGRTLYFMSDRSGAENIWEMAPGAQPRALTHFSSGRVLWPTMGARAKAVVFERDFGIWKLDLGKGSAAAVPIRLQGAPSAPSISQETITDVTAMAVSRDGKKAAFVAHGEVFAAGTDSGGDAIRVTHTGRLQFDLQWSPDNRHLAYVSDRDGHDHVYQYDFETNQEAALTSGNNDENHVSYSPDGKKLAFQRGVGQAVVLDLASRQEAVVAQGYFGSLPPLGGRTLFTWSPDSKYLAYVDAGDGWFPNAYIVPAAGGKGQQVSFLANANSSGPVWSPDGKFLLLQTSQRTEATRIARIDLVPRLPEFREDAFHQL